MTTNETDQCGCGVGHPAGATGQGRYCVNTEGTEHEWRQPTITTEQIAELGGWPASLGVIEVDIHNNERTLAPGEVVELQPGRGFCRRIRWKRGWSRPQRIEAELDLLREIFPELEFRENWVRIPGVRLPEGWNRPQTDVAFQISDAYPGAPPYGIYVPAGLKHQGRRPQNYTEPAGTQPPFGGAWGVFSWSVADANDWRPVDDVRRGANLLLWARGFAARFAEGA